MVQQSLSSITNLIEPYHYSLFKQGAIARLNHRLGWRTFVVDRLKENRYCKSIQPIKSAMTDSEVRQKVLHEVSQLPSEQLALVANFIEFLQFKRSGTLLTPATPPLNDQPILTGSTATDLLKFAGTWQGDDFEECLQSVYDSRLPAEF